MASQRDETLEAGEARGRSRGALPALAAAVLLALPMLVSCSLPPKLTALLFEGVPPPGKELPPQPVVRQPRRAPYKPPVAQKKKRVKPPARPSLAEWSARYKKLPRDKLGGVEWVRALELKLIAPKAGLKPKDKPQMVFDYNIELVPAGLPAFKVVYPHKPHTEWLGCTNCHTEIFQMKKGADHITMAKIFAGEFCGRCHGKVSFALTYCGRCHVEMQK